MTKIYVYVVWGTSPYKYNTVEIVGVYVNRKLATRALKHMKELDIYKNQYLKISRLRLRSDVKNLPRKV